MIHAVVSTLAAAPKGRLRLHGSSFVMTTLATPTTSRLIEVPTREEILKGMQVVDLSRNRRIPIMMEMVGELSRATEPKQVQKAFADGMLKLDGPRGYVSLSTRGLPPGQYKVTRILTDVSLTKSSEDPWRDWDKLPAHTGGFFGEIIRKAYPELIYHLRLENDPAVGSALAKYRSMMAIPLFDDGEPLNWSSQFDEDPEGFSIAELEDRILRANLGGATVRNVMMTKQLREANAKIREEIDQIAKIQKSLLPQSLPHIPGVSIATSYETFDTAGGDLYDFIQFPSDPGADAKPDDPLAILIADASGHGPAASVVTAMLNAILYAYPHTKGATNSPANLLEYANCHLYAKRLEGTFVTAFLAVYDPKTRMLQYARAGHNPPLIKNTGSGGSVRRLDDVGGIPLGVMDDVSFETGQVQLERGQTIVLYTDGITEGMNHDRVMFGVEGIETALEQCSGEPACVINSVTTALRAHENGVRPADDQTIVAMKVE
jgi:sigma-B regulation protein RsbU (phosphoserine phosphatase)